MIYLSEYVNTWATEGRPVQINVATAAVLLVVMYLNSNFGQLINVNQYFFIGPFYLSTEIRG